jgi:hypothetical protein
VCFRTICGILWLKGTFQEGKAQRSFTTGAESFHLTFGLVMFKIAVINLVNCVHFKFCLPQLSGDMLKGSESES